MYYVSTQINNQRRSSGTQRLVRIARKAFTKGSAQAGTFVHTVAVMAYLKFHLLHLGATDLI